MPKPASRIRLVALALARMVISWSKIRRSHSSKLGIRHRRIPKLGATGTPGATQALGREVIVFTAEGVSASCIVCRDSLRKHPGPLASRQACTEGLLATIWARSCRVRVCRTIPTQSASLSLRLLGYRVNVPQKVHR
jgi:hypothetical protein